MQIRQDDFDDIYFLLDHAVQPYLVHEIAQIEVVNGVAEAAGAADNGLAGAENGLAEGVGENGLDGAAVDGLAEAAEPEDDMDIAHN